MTKGTQPEQERDILDNVRIGEKNIDNEVGLIESAGPFSRRISRTRHGRG